MKVTTDACLFGAMIAANTATKESPTVLDIGTGTGLLSLMFLQHHPKANVDAIEIDENACLDAEKNFNESPWSTNLQLTCGDVLQLKFEKQYDIIIANPPFYEQQLKGPKHNRNLAHHDDGLQLEDLFMIIGKQLKPGGSAWVLLPFYRKENCLHHASKHGLLLKTLTIVKPRHDKAPTRIIVLFTNNQSDQHDDETITIYDEHQQYTSQFVTYLKPYYLYL